MALNLLLLCLLLCWAIEPAGAQPRPSAVRSLMEQNDNAGAPVIRIDTLTPEQREFYEKGRTRKNGYFAVAVASNYLDVIRELEKRTNRSADAAIEVAAVTVKTQNVPDFKYLGQFVESPGRSNLFFQDDSGNRAMLTVWNFVESGGRVFIINDFQNVTLDGVKGNLALAQAAGERRVIWKLAWILPGDKTQAELSVEDTLDSAGKPSRSPDSIKALAASLL